MTVVVGLFLSKYLIMKIKFSNSELRFYLSVFLTIIGCIVVFWFLIRGYFYENYINIKYSVDLDSASNFGEFIGGIVGTIFSFVGVILLFETLSFQRKEFRLSRSVFKHQQFDNTFFELLQLHKENVQMFITYDFESYEKKGRNFFIFQKESLHDHFKPEYSIRRNRKNAIELFRQVYSEYEEEFSIYFKTLYQLYSLIDTSDIDEEHKAKYSKILRAQLSSAELFFIRYNAMSDFGKNSVYYINKYNILKHLSYYDLLEFTYWWRKLSPIEKNGLNFVIGELKYNFKEGFTGRRLQKKYNGYDLNFYFISENEFEFILKFNQNTTKSISLMIKGINKFSNDEIENLFKCLFKEFLFGSNFYTYNKKNIEIKRKQATSDSIIINVCNIRKEKIVTRYKNN